MAIEGAPRLCGCGCRTPVKKWDAEFAPGHYSRVAKRSDGRIAARPKPPCGCGCGVEVASTSARFLSGHSSRTPEWRESFRAKRRGEGRERTCPECKQKMWVKPSRDKQWRVCGKECAAARRRRFEPRNQLQARCIEWTAERHSDLTTLAREVGMPPHRLLLWLRQGVYAKHELIRALATYFGIPYAKALSEAGGETFEEWSRRTARERATAVLGNPRGSDEAKARAAVGGRASRGVTRRKGTGERISAALKASPRRAEYNARLAEIHGTLRMRLLHSLVAWLKAHPAASRADIEARAELVADRYGLTGPAVMTAWRDFLERSGRLPSQGRPRSTESRCELVRAVYANWPRTPAGNLKHGFLSRAFQLVKAQEGDAAPADEESLRRWWLAERRQCPEAAALKSGR